MANQLLNKQGKVKYKGKWINIEDLPKGAKPDIDQANIYGTNLFSSVGSTNITDLGNLGDGPNTYGKSFSSLANLDTTDRFSKYGLSNQGSAGRYAQSLEAKLNADKGGLFGKGWFTGDNMDMFAAGAEGIGNLIGAWQALEAVKLGKQELAHNKFTSKADYNAQLGLLNRKIGEKNAFMDANAMTQKWAPLQNAYNVG